MNRYGMGFWASGCLVALTLTCACAAQENSQANQWNGSWKADPSSMKFDGPTVTIATTANGYTMTRGDGKPITVVCDGKPNAPVDGVVTTCTKTPTGYSLENSRDGKTTNRTKVEISPDGGTMTRTIDVMPAQGSPFTVTAISDELPLTFNTTYKVRCSMLSCLTQ